MNRYKTTLILLLIVVKVLYTYLCILMLPENWLSFDFDRNINLENIFFEVIPFCLCLYAYLKFVSPGNPISFALSIFFCLYVIPSNCCMSISGYSFLYYISINLFNALVLWFAGKYSSSCEMTRIQIAVDKYGIESNKRLQKIFRFVTIFTCFGVIGYVYYLRGSISLKGIFSEDIYEIRSLVADLYMNNVGGPIAYLMLIWTAFYSTMLIVGLYLSLRNKHYMDTSLCIFAYLLLFAFEAQKSVLFKPLIAIFVYYLYKQRRIQSIEKVFLCGYVSLLVVSAIEYYCHEESMVFSIVLRRMAYMPQYLAHTYYSFFDLHDKLWLTRDFFQLERIVRIFYPSPYEHGAVTIIADNCFPGVPSPNTGLFAEAFSQLGYLGVILFPVLIGYILKLFMKYSMIFGQGASHVLIASFMLSLINIQVLAPRGILIVLIFILISLFVKREVVSKSY